MPMSEYKENDDGWRCGGAEISAGRFYVPLIALNVAPVASVVFYRNGHLARCILATLVLTVSLPGLAWIISGWIWPNLPADGRDDSG